MQAQSAAAPEIVTALRSICMALPEVVEEQAWVGRRRVIRKETFAHLLLIDDGWLAPQKLVTNLERPASPGS